MSKFYIGTKTRNGGMRPPAFSTDMWCMYHHIINETPFTNNSLEAFNGNFNKSQIGPQTVYTCIKGFKREVEITKIILRELTGGLYPGDNITRKLLKKNKCKKSAHLYLLLTIPML